MRRRLSSKKKNRMARLFLDFDGTLIDPRPRLYSLFQELAPESQLSFDEYWRIKRGRATQRDVLRGYLNYSDAQIAVFNTAWMQKIEEPERLSGDKPLPGAADFLARMSKKMPLYLVTARQNPARARQQVDGLGWGGYFTSLLVTAQKAGKDEVIRLNAEFSPRDTLIGDTGEDIVAGKKLGLRTVAVCSGILSRDILAEYKPDMIIDSVAAFEVPE